VRVTPGVGALSPARVRTSALGPAVRGDREETSLRAATHSANATRAARNGEFSMGPRGPAGTSP